MEKVKRIVWELVQGAGVRDESQPSIRLLAQYEAGRVVEQGRFTFNRGTSSLVNGPSGEHGKVVKVVNPHIVDVGRALSRSILTSIRAAEKNG